MYVGSVGSMDGHPCAEIVVKSDGYGSGRLGNLPSYVSDEGRSSWPLRQGDSGQQPWRGGKFSKIPACCMCKYVFRKEELLCSSLLVLQATTKGEKPNHWGSTNAPLATWLDTVALLAHLRCEHHTHPQAGGQGTPRPKTTSRSRLVSEEATDHRFFQLH